MDNIEIKNKEQEWKILAERLSYLEENINQIESMIRNQQTLEISIHAPERGATRRLPPPHAPQSISIHAPERGATWSRYSHG